MVNCNVVMVNLLLINYQQDSTVLYIFVANEYLVNYQSFDQQILYCNRSLEFSYIEVWFADRKIATFAYSLQNI